MKKQILIALILVSSAISLNAQIYTPGGTVQGSSGNNNVGIGTASPSKLLDVNGDARIGNLSSRHYLKISSLEWPEIRFETSSSDENIRIGIAHKDDPYYLIQEGDLYFYTATTNSMPFVLKRNGNIILNSANGMAGIGTISPTYKLDVCGTIRAKEIKVDLLGGCDFVFKPDYKLMDLKTLEQFVKTNQHLPEIASEKEMVDNGINMKEMQMKLLQKMEEMTLYIIEQNKKNEQQNQEMKEIKEKIEKLETASK